MLHLHSGKLHCVMLLCGDGSCMYMEVEVKLYTLEPCSET